jgi:hypothetical protein
MTPDRDFARLESHLQSSLLIRAVDAIAGAWQTAANRSAAARWIRNGRDRFRSVALEGRVRAVAAFVATATIGHLLLLRFIAAHIAPALPKAFWSLIALTALIVAIAAKPVAHAWRSSFAARLSAFVSRS